MTPTVAVIDSLRVESMPAESGPPRSRALAVLRNFRANLPDRSRTLDGI